MVMPLWIWLTSDTNATKIGALGLIITTAAFGVTIWQLWATRREVRRAINEIDRFKENLRSEESIQLVALLTEQLRQAIAVVRAGKATPTFDMLERVRQGVARLSSLREQAGDDFSSLEAGARSLSDFMTANERVGGQLPEQDRHSAIKALRKLQADVATADGKMRDSRK